MQLKKARKVCDLIAEGMSIRAACEQLNVKPSTFMLCVSKPEFSAHYTRAREERADSRFEKLDQVVKDMRTGVIDSQMARVEIDTLKWQMGKERPKVYGERLELAGDQSAPILHRVEFVSPKPRE